MLRLWAFDLLALVGVEPALQRPGAAVVEAMALAFPAQFLLAASSYFLEGISRPRRVMAVNLLMLPVNALLAWAWVGGHLGLPALGAVGAAYATATVSWLGAAAMIALIWLLPRAQERRVRDFSPAALRRALAGVPALAWFGLMPAIGASLELAGFAWLMVLSTQLGNAAAGAFQAMLSIHNLAFALSMGFGSAAGVRVGNAVGAGRARRGLAARADRRRARRGRCSACSRCSSSFGRGPWSGPSRTIRRCSRSPPRCWRSWAPSWSSTASNMCSAPRLRSLGEQVWAGINGIIGFFVVTGGLGWLLVREGWGAGRARLCGRRSACWSAPCFSSAGLRLGAQEIGPKLRLSVRPPRGTSRLGAVERHPAARPELAHRRRDRPVVDDPALRVAQLGADLRDALDLVGLVGDLAAHGRAARCRSPAAAARPGR